MPASQAQIDHAVSLFEAAAKANTACEHRQGNLVNVPSESGNDVMVTTDLHGNRLHFEKLLRIADLQEHDGRHLVMQEVCHGGPTYPNSSACMSHLLLEDVAQLKITYPDRFHFLLSNHELAEITEFPISKHGRVLNLAFRFGIQTFYGEGAQQVHQAMCTFLSSCPLGIRIADHTLVTHSLPEDIAQFGFDTTVFERPLDAADWKPRSDLFRLLWGRDFSETNARMFCDLMHVKNLIHGHEHCDAGFMTPNSHQIIIDSCGDLGCYVILESDSCLAQSEIIQRIAFLKDASKQGL